MTGVGKSSQLLARDRLLVTKSAKKIVHALALANGTEVIETVTGAVEIGIVVAGIAIAAAEIVTSVIAGDKTTDGTKRKATIDIGIEAEAATVNIVVMTDVDLLLFRSLAFFLPPRLNGIPRQFRDDEWLERSRQIEFSLVSWYGAGCSTLDISLRLL